MDREFLEFYNRELQVLQEQALEFAEEYPGIAERLGGLVGERADPMVAGLLEGTAFLAARVQLKLKHEFSEFTSNLLEQLLPNYLAPTPSAMLARVCPPFADAAALREGQRIAAGSYLDATYLERDRRIACRYRLASPVTLWPFDVVAAEYHAGVGPLQALGVPVPPAAAAGLRLTLTHRTAARIEDEVSDELSRIQPQTWFAGCRATELPIHLVGPEGDAAALYEQLAGDVVGVSFRYLDAFGDPVVVPAPRDCIVQAGFGDDALLPGDMRIFRGFDWLREYFMFPRKFLGVSFTGLGQVLPRLPAKTVDVIVTFDEANPRLQAAVQPGMFALYAAPAVNLFEKTADRIAIKSNQHEYHLVPDRSRYLDFEPHRVLEVYAHYTGGRDKVPVPPLYSAPEAASGRAGLYHTVRRVPRRTVW
jgi:type VI secretion system protein ImpG